MKKWKRQKKDKPENTSKNTVKKEETKTSAFMMMLEWLTKPSKKLKLNRQILVVAYTFSFLFIALMGFLAYYVAVDSKKDIVSSYNPRKDIYTQKIKKGEMKTADGKTIAKSVKLSDGSYERSYPFDHLFAQVVGYDINGKSGLESSANYYLYSSNINVLDKVVNELKNEKNPGDTVTTTLNYTLQKAASDALGNRKGAVVVMEPATGKILAMVSKPDYDPNHLKTLWNTLSKKNDSALLNRATQGLYPPGSTFKIVTALEYMREHSDWRQFSYQCRGTTIVDNVNIKCAGRTAHGRLDLAGAMAHSCNCAFVTMASDLNPASFRETANQLLFNQKMPIALEYSKSQFVLDKNSEKSAMPQTAIGQGDTLISPLLNCMIISAVANNGVMMTPYLVDKVESADGRLITKTSPSEYKRVMKEKEASSLEKMLKQVVTSGTASALSGLEHSYAGKTGTAEHGSNDQAHAWFVGYSPVEDPEIAVCVIVEDGGSGSGVAVPVAKQIFTAYYD